MTVSPHPFYNVKVETLGRLAAWLERKALRIWKMEVQHSLVSALDLPSQRTHPSIIPSQCIRSFCIWGAGPTAATTSISGWKTKIETLRTSIT